MSKILKSPLAYIPMMMSAVALVLVLVHISFVGMTNVPGADEGAPARIFQLLLAVQMPIIVIFLIRYFPKKPGAALGILTIQITLVLIALFTVFILER